MRRIVVITGTRAEYGILEPVLDAIDAHAGLELKLVVTGTHLITNSIDDIDRPIAARVPMQVKDAKSSRAEDVQALSRGVSGFGEVFGTLSPDIVVLLGDRIEAVAGALAGQVGGHQVAHLHGGDRAEGVADEAMRHAISKLAHLHFAATAQSRDRLIRMGEHADHVYNTGSPAVDGLAGVVPADDAPDLILMQHPIGEAIETEQRWMDATLNATADYSRMVLSPNHDPGREGIVQAIADHGLTPIDHLPRAGFLAMLAGARAIVGNSSAGLIEAAVLGTPAVNVGSRQGGRERPASVMDADYTEQSLADALCQALLLDTTYCQHPYGDGQAGARIADLLASLDLDSIPLRKRNAY